MLWLVLRYLVLGVCWTGVESVSLVSSINGPTKALGAEMDNMEYKTAILPINEA